MSDKYDNVDHNIIGGGNASFLGFVNPFALPVGKMLLVLIAVVLIGSGKAVKRGLSRNRTRSEE